MSTLAMSIANGAGAFLDVYDDCVVIRREGWRQRAVLGSEGEKRFSYKDISAVHVHYPKKGFTIAATTGYIQFTVAGANESWTAEQMIYNPNAFVFGKADIISQVESAEKYIKAALESVSKPKQTTTSVADEILKFKSLLEMGVISEEEFENQKAKLLN